MGIATVEEIGGNKRLEKREALSFKCPGRVAGRAITEVELFDVSARGAKVRIARMEIDVGDKIELFLNDLDGTWATVRRVGQQSAGLEFDEALPLHVFERFVFDNAFRVV